MATSWGSFRNYQTDEAWVWEHLALTRARVVAGDAGLGADIERFRAGLLPEKGADRAEVLKQLREMRARIAGAKAPQGAGMARSAPGGCRMWN